MVNWFRVLKFSVEREYKHLYPNNWVLFTVLLSELMTLVVYYFTAMAFAPKEGFFANDNIDYFTFVVLGELVLLIPLSLMSSFSRIVKIALSDESLETFFFNRFGALNVVTTLGLGVVPIRIGHFLVMLAFAYGILGFQVPGVSWIQIVPLILISTPAFIGFGLVTAAVILRFGRGERWIYFASNAISVFAGVYFPLTIFPASIQTALEALTPFSYLLHQARRASADMMGFSLESLFILGSWGVVLLVLGVWLFKWSLEQRRQGIEPATIMY